MSKLQSFTRIKDFQMHSWFEIYWVDRSPTTTTTTTTDTRVHLLLKGAVRKNNRNGGTLWKSDIVISRLLYILPKYNQGRKSQITHNTVHNWTAIRSLTSGTTNRTAAWTLSVIASSPPNFEFIWKVVVIKLLVTEA